MSDRSSSRRPVPTLSAPDPGHSDWSHDKPADVQVVTVLERRRQWSEEQRAAIVSETMQPGATVLAVARKYDVHPRCIFRWKQKLLATNALVEVPAPVSATLPSAPQKKRRGRPRKQIPPPTAVPTPRVFAVEPAPPVAAIVPSDSVRLVVGDLVIAISTVKGL